MKVDVGQQSPVVRTSIGRSSAKVASVARRWSSRTDDIDDERIRLQVEEDLKHID